MALALNATMACAIVAAVVLAIQPVDAIPDVQPSTAATLAPKEQAAAPSPSDYDVIAEANFYRPLFDEAPPPPPTTNIAPPPLPVRLIGTVVESGFSYAMFRTVGGETRMVGIGETVDGVQVVSLTEKSATVLFSGQTLTLPVDAAEAKP